eukprot:SAG22_NODE_411_length_10900_cov_2.633738_5_plen_265_part_00
MMVPVYASEPFVIESSEFHPYGLFHRVPLARREQQVRRVLVERPLVDVRDLEHAEQPPVRRVAGAGHDAGRHLGHEAAGDRVLPRTGLDRDERGGLEGLDGGAEPAPKHEGAAPDDVGVEAERERVLGVAVRAVADVLDPSHELVIVDDVLAGRDLRRRRLGAGRHAGREGRAHRVHLGRRERLVLEAGRRLRHPFGRRICLLVGSPLCKGGTCCRVFRLLGRSSCLLRELLPGLERRGGLRLRRRVLEQLFPGRPGRREPAQL